MTFLFRPGSSALATHTAKRMACLEGTGHSSPEPINERPSLLRAE